MKAREKLRAAIQSDTQLKNSIRDQINIQEHAGEGELKILKLETINLNQKNPRKSHISIEEIKHLLTQTSQSVTGRLGDVLFDQALLNTINKINNKVKKERLESLYFLAKSIQTQGLIQPISVSVNYDRNYIIIAGERRFLAHVLIGRDTIRAIVREQSSNEVTNRTLSLIENINREDLNTSEKIDFIEQLIKIQEKIAGKKLNATDLSSMIHESHRSCRRYLRYITAPEQIRNQITLGKLTSIRDIEEALKGQTLEKKKHTSTEQTKQQRAGRKRTSISLGKITDTRVIQIISEALSSTQKLPSPPSELNWDDYESVQTYWNSILRNIIKNK